MYLTLKNTIDVDLLKQAFNLTWFKMDFWAFEFGTILSSFSLSSMYEGVPNWIVPIASVLVLFLSVGVQFYKLLNERQKSLTAKAETRQAEALAHEQELKNKLIQEEIEQAEIKTESHKKKLKGNI